MKEYIILTIISIVINIVNFFLYKSCYQYESIGWDHYYIRNTVSLLAIIIIGISCFIPLFNICIAVLLLLNVIYEVSDCSKSKVKDFFSKKF